MLCALTIAICVVVFVLVTLSLPAPPARGAGTAVDPTEAGNPIAVENQLPGDPKWRRDEAPMGSLEGYTSQVSVAPGQTLDLHVSTDPAERYRVVFYRLGWYGGAGARMVGCLPSCATDEQGAPQSTPPPDPSTGFVDAGWPVTDSLTVPSDWVTGYYVAGLYMTTGPYAGRQRLVPFIVRAPAGDPAPILVQASVNTWEAYNCFGGQSLYPNCGSGVPVGVKVSFNRPYLDGTLTGVSLPLEYEYSLVRYLERSGDDVSYTTDVDTDLDPGSLLAHKVVIVNGHDEYWSGAMRTAFDDALAAGVNLVFMGADLGDWQIRYEQGDRTIVEYRSSVTDPDPVVADQTVRFDDLGIPECNLMGVEYQGGKRLTDHDAPRDYVVTAAGAASPWLRGTGLTQGSDIPSAVGPEWDSRRPFCEPTGTPTLLWSWSGSAQNLPDADSVTYTAPSGGRVFAAGSLRFNWLLDPWTIPSATADPSLQTFVANMLADLETGPAVTPVIVLRSPMGDVGYIRRQVIRAAFSCTVAPPATITHCQAPAASGAAIDTRRLGRHRFRVTVETSAGMVAARSVTYSVLPRSPRLRAVRQARSRWRRSRGMPAVRYLSHRSVVLRRGGTAFVFRLNEPARVTIGFRSCRPPRATVCSKPLGRWSFEAVRAGRLEVVFGGRISPHATLRPGSDAVIFTATNAAGVRSVPHRLVFTIVR